MRKEKSNLRTRSREGTNIQQTSDRARRKEKGCYRLSVHTSALLVSQAEGLPAIASPLLLHAGTRRWWQRPGSH